MTRLRDPKREPLRVSVATPAANVAPIFPENRPRTLRGIFSSNVRIAWVPVLVLGLRPNARTGELPRAILTRRRTPSHPAEPAGENARERRRSVHTSTGEETFWRVFRALPVHWMLSEIVAEIQRHARAIVAHSTCLGTQVKTATSSLSKRRTTLPTGVPTCARLVGIHHAADPKFACFPPKFVVVRSRRQPGANERDETAPLRACSSMAFVANFGSEFSR